MAETTITRLEKAWITVLIEGQSTWVECHQLWRCRGPDGGLDAEDRALLRRYRERIARLRQYLYAHRTTPLEGTGLWYRVVTAMMRASCRGPRWGTAAGYALVTGAEQCMATLGRLFSPAEVRVILSDQAIQGDSEPLPSPAEDADLLQRIVPGVGHA